MADIRELEWARKWFERGTTEPTPAEDARYWRHYYLAQEQGKDATYLQEWAYKSYETNLTYISKDSAFHPDNIAAATLITLTRIYDAQMAMLGALDPEAALYLQNQHEQGHLLSSPPAFLGE